MMIEQNFTETTENPSEIAEGTIELRRVYKEEIARVLNLIALDSVRYPERYLLETLVPHGGE